MTTSAEIQTKVNKTITNMDRLDGIVNGDNTTTVTVDGPQIVPSIQKAIKDSIQYPGKLAIDAFVSDGADKLVAVQAQVDAALTGLESFASVYVFASSYTADTTGLTSAEADAVEPGTPANTRSWKGRTLTIDSPITLDGTVNPRVTTKVEPTGLFTRVSGNMTFFGPFEAGRYQVFEGYAAVNLSFLRGTDTMPEWFHDAATVAADVRASLQFALDAANYGKVLLDARDYSMSANVNVTRSYTGIIGKGEVITNIDLTGAAVSGIQINPAGNDGSRLSRTELRDFTITRSVTATGGVGIASYWTQGGKMTDIQISNCLIGVTLVRSPNTEIERVTVDFDSNLNNFRGFHWDGDGGGSGALGNASTSMYDCAVSRPATATGTNAIGLLIDGTYAGDVVVERFDTVRCDIGVYIDLTTVTGNSSGNADIILRELVLDYYSVAGVLIQGNVDNYGMITIDGGWFDPRPGYAGAIGVLVMSSIGVYVNKPQFALAGSAGKTGVEFNASSDCHLNGGQIKEQSVGIRFNGAFDCTVGGEANFYNTGNLMADIHVSFENYSSRCEAKNIKIGKASSALIGVKIDGTCSNCVVELGPSDMTNIPAGQLIMDYGTRSVIRYDGPATDLTLSGTNTRAWTRAAAYTATVGNTGGGAFGNASASLKYQWVGDSIRIYGTVSIVNVGTASGVLTLTLPRTPAESFDQPFGSGTRYRTEWPTEDKALRFIIYSNILRVPLADGTAGLASGAFYEVDFTYRVSD